MTMNVVMYVAWLGVSLRHKGRSGISRDKIATLVNPTNRTSISFVLMDPKCSWPRDFLKMMLTELLLPNQHLVHPQMSQLDNYGKSIIMRMLNMTLHFLREHDFARLDFYLLLWPTYLKGFIAHGAFF